MDTSVNLKFKNAQYSKNLPILLSIIDRSVIKEFLKQYYNFLVLDFDIYIHKFLFHCNLIDKETFEKIDKKKWSITKLALRTNFELATTFELDLWTAQLISILSQFHYSNLFYGFTVYYAHSMGNYSKIIEDREMKIIKDHSFPIP